MPSAGKVALDSTQGDPHDIGKNLAAMMLEGGGFGVVDLGIDVRPEKFVQAVKAEQPDVIGMSALLTTTRPFMKRTLDALVEAGVRENVKVMVGGAPVTQIYAGEIGANGYTPDAVSEPWLFPGMVPTDQALLLAVSRSGATDGGDAAGVWGLSGMECKNRAGPGRYLLPRKPADPAGRLCVGGSRCAGTICPPDHRRRLRPPSPLQRRCDFDERDRLAGISIPYFVAPRDTGGNRHCQSQKG